MQGHNPTDNIALPSSLATLVEAAELEAEPPLALRPGTPAPGRTLQNPKRRSYASTAHSTTRYPSQRFSTRLNWRNHTTQTWLEEGRMPSLKRKSQPRVSSEPVHWRPPGSRTSVSGQRNTSHISGYDMTNLVNIKHRRKRWVRIALEYGMYTGFAAFVYFVLIGMPLWEGAVAWLYRLVKNRFVFQGGWAIVIVLVILYSFTPLLLAFEEAPGPSGTSYNNDIHPYWAQTPGQTATSTCALIIPAYRSAGTINQTLTKALAIFPPSQIFVIANGTSSSPLDNTESICAAHNVTHIWVPIGSKIIALFVGCHAARGYKHVLLMDDDVTLPPDFPVVTERLRDGTQCISYTIRCAQPAPAPNTNTNTKMTWCQKAQDLEYKLAGLQRFFAGRIGSATFPHGAISLWDRTFLKRVLEHHPGFSISEDWFMGHTCRQLGGRIEMCSAVFVETGTPASMFWAPGGGRGGFGETTLFQQRFSRWNFFVASGLWHNLVYLLTSWRLGWWEVGAKGFVFQEVYETVTYLSSPFLLPISLLVKPLFCLAILAAIAGLYLLQAIIFNEVHLRWKKARSSWAVILGCYIPYKMCLWLINVAGCYWCLFRYARYFAQQRLKLTEDHKVVGMVLRLEEQMLGSGLGRRLTVRRMSTVNGET
ncbi:hypothetical protein BDW74DRAFT_170463 [Aspergillus multicolor]|uniref:uncharacterized protein n=1 Tax=Aspergillus multicolor TaxID=41759 RepID=UPI003CCD60A1